MSRDAKFLKGTVTIQLRDYKTGEVKSQTVSNLVTNSGTQWVAERMLDALNQGSLGSEEMSWIELGKSNQAPAGTDTNLITTFGPSSEVRKKYSTLSRTGSTWTIICNWGTSDANTSGIQEAGIFSTSDQSAVGTMLARTTFTAINKTNTDTLKIQWEINVADDGI